MTPQAALYLVQWAARHRKLIIGGLVASMTTAALPMILFIAIAGMSASSGASSCQGPAAVDGSPTIMGPSTLSAEQIAQWWQTDRPGPDPTITIGTGIATVAQLYVGNPDGVRGDLAFAQAVIETGGFTSPDATLLNNFAGIAHPDGAASGAPFPSVSVGVSAQTQLLAEVVLGNNTPFVEPKVAPNWGGRTVTTWAGLAGNWASATDYWTAISSVYQRMLTSAGIPASGAATVAATCSTLSAQIKASPAAVQTAIAFALAQVGKPYEWGATGPDSFDCSGLIQAAWAAAGVKLSRTTYTQVAEGTAVAEADLQPGDLLLPDSGHVQMVVSTNPVMVVEAPYTGSFVRVVPFWGFWAARRLVNPAG